MTRNSLTRGVLYFLLGSVINLAFFALAKYTAFPLWADYTGSFILAALCSPVLAFISAFSHTVLLIVLIDGYSALLPLLPALIVCVIIWLCLKNELHSHLQIGACSFYAAASVFVCNSIIILCSPDVYGRYGMYSDMLSMLRESFGRFFGSIIMSAAISLPEMLLSLIIFWVLYFILPKKTDRLMFKK